MAIAALTFPPAVTQAPPRPHPTPGSLPATPLSWTCGLSTSELSEGFPTAQPQDVLRQELLGKPPLPHPY